VQFEHNREQVTLKGLDTPPQMELKEISVANLQEMLSTNEVWAMTTVDSVDPTLGSLTSTLALDLQTLITEFFEVFADPPSLPPRHALDHAITLEPIAQPMNSRRYRYSPLKTRSRVRKKGVPYFL
jgi:hypothetical protein